MRHGNRESTSGKKRLVTILVAAAMLLALLVQAVGQIEWPTRIERFERYDPVYTAYVDVGTAREDLGLPEYLRAVIPLDELDLDADTFVQAQPEVDMSDGYTHYDYYYYGYVAPSGAAEKYENGELVVYTIYYAAQDGSGTVGELAYRVYGSINGSENVWFACDEGDHITGVVLDIPVTWSGDYDPDLPGQYTFTASFTGYSYGSSRPTAVVTVSDGTEGEDQENEEVVTCTCEPTVDEHGNVIHAEDCPAYTEPVVCTCELGLDAYSSEHAEDCPYYEEPEAILCTCELQTNTRGDGHAEDCPMYIRAAEDCHCGLDGGAIDADNYPWAHQEDCVWFSPIECMCREQIEITYEDNIDGETHIITSTVSGNFSHVHDPENKDCPLYGKDTVTIEKLDETSLSAQLMGGTASVMAAEDAERIVAYQESHVENSVEPVEEGQQEADVPMEETAGIANAVSPAEEPAPQPEEEPAADALYPALGEIVIVVGSEQSGYAYDSGMQLLSANGDGSNDQKMDAYINDNTATSGNSSYSSDFTGTTIPGSWVDYVNTIWMNNAVKGDEGFSWTADEDTGAHGAWFWSGSAASGTNGSVTTSANRVPASSGGVWTVYSGEQLRYAMEKFESGDTIRLGGDINLNGHESNWTTVYPAAGKSLTLDGQGCTIYNLGIYMTESDSGYGNGTLFLGRISEGVTVKDLTFATAKLVNGTGNNHTSIFRFQSGGAEGTNTELTNVNILGSMFYGSNLVSPFGRLSPSSAGMVPDVTKCSVIDSFVYGKDHVAGYCFGAGNDYYAKNEYDEDMWGSFTNCYSANNLICGTGGHSAGFASCNGEGAQFDSCFAANEIYGAGAVSGFVGGIVCRATNCFSSGKLEGYSVLGGFAFSYSNADIPAEAPRDFTNCYSTALVGLRSGADKQGGFSATLIYEDKYEDDGTRKTYLYHDEVQTDCYAAGEVGNFDIDMGAPESVGGYIDYKENPDEDVPENLYSFNNVYYDKQTTAMREWAAGDSQSVGGVTGLLTTELTSSNFNGFTDMDAWVIDSEGQHYPQLAVFANASVNDWGSQETANLVKAYSLASTSTVFLDDWSTGYTWSKDGVRSEDKEDWSTGEYALAYDTVRDIISDFTVTTTGGYSVAWEEKIEGGALAKVESAGSAKNCTCDVGVNEYSEDHDPSCPFYEHYGNCSCDVAENVYSDVHDPSCFYYATRDTVSVDNDTGRGTVDNPGMNWFDIVVTVDGQTGARPIRLIGYMHIEAGEDTTVSSGETYDHRDDVSLTMIDTLSEDLVVGLHDDDVWSRSIQMDWPVTENKDEEGDPVSVQAPGYYDVETEATNHGASYNAILNTEIWVAEMNSEDGGAKVYDGPGTDGDYYYDANASGYIKAATAVYVTGAGSENNLAQQKFRGEIPLYPDTSSARKYIISYYWLTSDGRYVTDYKIITIKPGDYTVDMYVYNMDGSENSDLLALDVQADDEEGETTYNFNYGADGKLETASTASLPYNEEFEDYSVKYTTNVTAAWGKVSSEVIVQQIQLDMYYRDGTLAGSVTVNGPVEDGTELKVPTLLYYYLDTVTLATSTDGTGGTDRETTLKQYVDITYTVQQDETTGAYYLRFNKLVNEPEDEWDGATGGVNDETGMTPTNGEDLEAYINDLQFNVKITLWVTGGALGGRVWEDVNNDGIFDEEIEDETALHGMKVSLMRPTNSVNGGTVLSPLLDENGNEVFVEIYAGNVTEKIYTMTYTTSYGKKMTYSIIAKTNGGEYIFIGLPDGTYAVEFAADELLGIVPTGSGDNEQLPLGAYNGSPLGADATEELTSKADSVYVDESGAEYPGRVSEITQGRWLSRAEIREIELGPTQNSSESTNGNILMRALNALTGGGDATAADEDNAVSTDYAYTSLHNNGGFVLRTGKITIQKTDDSGNELSGVSFQLERYTGAYDEDGTPTETDSDDAWEKIEMEAVDDDSYMPAAEGDNNASTQQQTNSTGKLIYTNLEPGTYRLTETGSTSGNSLLAEAVYITIPYSMSDGDEGSTEAATTDPSYRWNGVSYWLDLVYDITNQAIFPLPVSGGWGTMWYFIAGGCLILLGGAVTLGVTAGRRRMRLRLLRDTLFKW